MRIVAGRWRGRRIEAPSGEQVRPTGDRVRESWMSIVHSLLPEARVLDLCAGSGALGLEALSRGAASCDFVENAPRSLDMIQANLDHLGGHVGAVVHRDDAVAFVRRLRPLAYDIAFADPPYATDTAMQIVQAWLDTPFAAVLGLEHPTTLSMPAPGHTRRYGATSLTFYRTADP
ncbi:MAG: 16S rRNA (guanine(966)-N(2))-methyltransferase RsmD [Gemmatimonadaceae bacterium]|nr:16S rRNA (guanine(966)-N(2))-methyltransferase RsmD [Gemmatimonadaceae bacterium]